MQFIEKLGVFPNSSTRPRKAIPRLIVIHYSYTHSPTSTVNVLNNKGLSTHFEVDKYGNVYRYVDPAKRFAFHGGKLNSRSIGIDVTSTGTFTSTQIDSVRRLVTYLCNRFSIPQVVAPDGVKYTNLGQIEAAGVGILRHRNLRPTQCPGTFPMEEMTKPLGEGLATWEKAALVAAGMAAFWLWRRRRRT